jgi:hypothetical protein
MRDWDGCHGLGRGANVVNKAKAALAFGGAVGQPNQKGDVRREKG